MLFEHQYKGKLNRPNLSAAFAVPAMDDVSKRLLTAESFEEIMIFRFHSNAHKKFSISAAQNKFYSNGLTQIDTIFR